MIDESVIIMVNISFGIPKFLSLERFLFNNLPEEYRIYELYPVELLDESETFIIGGCSEEDNKEAYNEIYKLLKQFFNK